MASASTTAQSTVTPIPACSPRAFLRLLMPFAAAPRPPCPDDGHQADGIRLRQGRRESGWRSMHRREHAREADRPGPFPELIPGSDILVVREEAELGATDQVLQRHEADAVVARRHPAV